MDLKCFLEKYVEGYLFGDLETMKTSVPSSQKGGGVGYPLLASTFSGIELLGALVSKATFNTYNGSIYFNDFWSNYLYSNDVAKANAGKYIYELARHGIAHTFLMKGDITITKNSTDPHLVKDGTTVYINSFQLAVDLKFAYDIKFLNLVRETTGDVNGTTIQQRLDEMEKTYISQSGKTMGDLLANLPARGPSGPRASPLSQPGYSGAAFPPGGPSQQPQLNNSGPTVPTVVGSTSPFK